LKALIYQVGRFDNPKDSVKNFFIKDFHGEKVDYSNWAELSSLFLKDFLLQKGFEAKTVLVYPVSIVFNNKFVNYITPDSMKSELLSIFETPSMYLKNPDDFISKINLENKRDDKLIVHSLGEYMGISLDASYDDIVLEVLFDITKRYLEEPFKRLYIDISSGHNIYISAMLEASRHFAVFSYLMHWVDEKNVPEIYISFSDPILGSSASSYEINIQKQNFTAFFASLINRKEASEHNFSFLRNIYSEPKDVPKGAEGTKIKQQIREKRKKLREKVEMFCYLFSAIKNNVPLYLYYQHYHSEGEVIEEILKLIENAKEKLLKDFKSSAYLDKGAYLKALLSLGFYLGIIRVLEMFNITMFCQDRGIELDTIKKNFIGIYDIFKIPTNYVMLGNEISNTEKFLNELDDIKNWTGLYKLISPSSSQTDPDERNYFAHSGFERNVTEVRMNEGKIFVRYAHNTNMNIINCWLKSRIE